MGSMIDPLLAVQLKAWERFIHSATDAMVIRDRNGVFLCINQLFVEMRGWNANEILGKGYEVFSQNEAVHCRSALQQVLDERDTVEFEDFLMEKEGRGFPIRVTIMPLFNGAGEIGAFVIRLQDRSEQILMQEKLHLREEILGTFLEMTGSLVCVMDDQYRLLMFNSACEELTGFTEEEVLGKNAIHLLIPPEEHSRIYKMEEELLAGTHTFCENHWLTKEGEKRLIFWNNTMLFDSDSGKARYMVSIGTDITEKRKTEEWFQRSDKMNTVAELASAVGHEIRNPLTTIRGFIQFLYHREDPSTDRYYDLIISEIDRINLITSEFMSLAKPQAVDFKAKNVLHILQNTLLLFESQAHLRGIEVKFAVELDNPWVICEENQLKQVFINILKNALEAQVKGEIIVHVDQIDEEVRIRFIDQGAGISPDMLKKLGQPFYSTKDKGTGLGLFVCQRIIESHGGALSIASDLGKGTVVDLRLPLRSET